MVTMCLQRNAANTRIWLRIDWDLYAGRSLLSRIEFMILKEDLGKWKASGEQFGIAGMKERSWKASPKFLWERIMIIIIMIIIIISWDNPKEAFQKIIWPWNRNATELQSLLSSTLQGSSIKYSKFKESCCHQVSSHWKYWRRQCETQQ